MKQIFNHCLPNNLFCTNPTVSQILETLTCPIFSGILHDPVTDSTGHTFCRSCIKDWIASQLKKEAQPTCPICRIPISEQGLTQNLIAKKLLDNLRVQCPHSPRGCSWTGQLQSFERHIIFECPFKNVKLGIIDNNLSDLPDKEFLDVFNFQNHLKAFCFRT